MATIKDKLLALYNAAITAETVETWRALGIAAMEQHVKPKRATSKRKAGGSGPYVRVMVTFTDGVTLVGGGYAPSEGGIPDLERIKRVVALQRRESDSRATDPRFARPAGRDGAPHRWVETATGWKLVPCNLAPMVDVVDARLITHEEAEAWRGERFGDRSLDCRDAAEIEAAAHVAREAQRIAEERAAEKRREEIARGEAATRRHIAWRDAVNREWCRRHGMRLRRRYVGAPDFFAPLQMSERMRDAVAAFIGHGDRPRVARPTVEPVAPAAELAPVTVEPVEPVTEIDAPRADAPDAPNSAELSVAEAYATLLGQRVAGFHIRFAQAINRRDAEALQFLANGLNHKGKRIFSQFTGVRFPRGQAATWAAIRAWAGHTDEQEAVRLATLAARFSSEQRARLAARAERVKLTGGETGRAWVERIISESPCHLQAVKFGARTDYYLMTGGGSGFHLTRSGIGTDSLWRYAQALLAETAPVEPDAPAAELAPVEPVTGEPDAPETVAPVDVAPVTVAERGGNAPYFASEPEMIGKHLWRVVVIAGRYDPDKRVTEWQWRRGADDALNGHGQPVWNPGNSWPRWDDHNGETGGMPKGLKRIYARNRDAIDVALRRGTAYAHDADNLEPDAPETLAPVAPVTVEPDVALIVQGVVRFVGALDAAVAHASGRADADIEELPADWRSQEPPESALIGQCQAYVAGRPQLVRLADGATVRIKVKTPLAAAA